MCFNHFGHGYFLENGNETNNTITGNLGMRSKRIPTDRALLFSDANTTSPQRFAAPATFWITHPTNIVRGNVASGSEGTGFWLSLIHI